jgi:hypothetical protein
MRIRRCGCRPYRAQPSSKRTTPTIGTYSRATGGEGGARRTPMHARASWARPPERCAVRRCATCGTARTSVSRTPEICLQQDRTERPPPRTRARARANTLTHTRARTDTDTDTDTDTRTHAHASARPPPRAEVGPHGALPCATLRRATRLVLLRKRQQRLEHARGRGCRRRLLLRPSPSGTVTAALDTRLRLGTGRQVRQSVHAAWRAREPRIRRRARHRGVVGAARFSGNANARLWRARSFASAAASAARHHPTPTCSRLRRSLGAILVEGAARCRLLAGFVGLLRIALVPTAIVGVFLRLLAAGGRGEPAESCQRALFVQQVPPLACDKTAVVVTSSGTRVAACHLQSCTWKSCAWPAARAPLEQAGCDRPACSCADGLRLHGVPRMRGAGGGRR